MLEAKIEQAIVFKRVLDAIKDLVEHANFDCNEEGLRLQAMDSSHVALSAVELRADGFEEYRCDRPMSIGVAITSLTKVMRSAQNNDILNMRKADNADSLHLVFEGASSDRIGEFDLKLMDIDTEHLGIPDTEYDAVVKLSSNEFARICRDLSNVGESVKITITKEGVTFSTEGEIGDARMTLKQGSGSATSYDDDDEEAGLDGDGEEKPLKKRKTGASSSVSGGVVPVEIQLEKAVALTFSVQYLVNFTKAAPLSSAVTLHMADKVPLMVEFAFENGHVRYYLAPKLAETDED
ncbi:proliferating cell nuclear antigen [Malassezia vespertilionis]|uniref:proliferating cell nuclear antigen n=1 Tax=Malassezia vespertilionis TaxID=2020962 RepID=UPI0024B07177|nr:proliferating cell nuclear antigen [Malassezia vespertilionis]WFD05780.1 proliferating cell nuclear antigen [Malassezia vespertilionis]